MIAATLAGVDLGGTKLLGVVLDEEGDVVREARRPTPRGGPALLDALAEVAAELAPWDALGVGVAGRVTRSGVVQASPNLAGVRDLDVRAGVAERLGRVPEVDNDATTATLAEWRLGAGRGVADLVLVTLGTGIGGGFVLGGRVHRGAHGFAGEIGHVVVVPDGRPCVCGQRGCWERYASGSGLAIDAREAAEGGRFERGVDLAGGDPEAVRGEHVWAAAREDDADARELVDRFARAVALGLVGLVNTLDPEVVVLGGGLIGQADLLIEPVRRHLVDLLYTPDPRFVPRLEPAGLGERAGAVGAALLAGNAGQ